MLTREDGFGCIYLGLFGGIWMAIALQDASGWMLFGALLPGLLLCVRGLGLVRHAPPAPGGGIARVVLIEAALVAAAANSLAAYEQGRWVVPAIALLAAAHTTALGRVTRFPGYYWTGGAQGAGSLAWIALLHRRADLLDICLGALMAGTFWLTALVLLLRARPPQAPAPS